MSKAEDEDVHIGGRTVRPTDKEAVVEQSMRRIIAAIDLQDDSKTALTWLIQNVARETDEVHIVHVAKLKVRQLVSALLRSGACCDVVARTPLIRNTLMKMKWIEFQRNISTRVANCT